ncbi:MAG: LON peptidase substrate-binding domain-containing protein [Acidimicrobiales bacterium]|nr:LON peptidase substrate-binding domain-containing protein [Acidimicrobiales bacterium]
MRLPMFPLGSVLLPSVGLPLHVFELRYRALVRDCLAGDREFGVVLIERGSEVGGGDIRSDVGTVATIVEAEQLPDGRWGLLVVGTRRIRVEAWLPDDPYSQAEVAEWTDDPVDERHAELLVDVVARLRRVLGLAAEAGDSSAPATIELSDDPVLAGYQAVAVAPLGALDRQRLLAAASPSARLLDLGALLDDAAEVLELRIAGG